MGLLILLVVFVGVFFLPVVIRRVKWAYRSFVLVWAQEVRKAWLE